jgi:tetratricopeptide (TPR) repeat protein
MGAFTVPEFDQRLARAVKLKVADAAGEATIGTGYLAAPGIVLTARHVLRRGGGAGDSDYALTELRVRAATGPQSGRSLEVSSRVVLGETDGVDVAVLSVPGLAPFAGSALVGARITTDRPVQGASMIGYPKAAHESGTVAAEYVGGSVSPISGTANGRIVFQVTTPVARSDRGWSGLSGAGVVDTEGRLLGILTAVQLRWEDRLAVAPVDAIIAAARERLSTHPELRPLADVAVAEHLGDDPLFDRSKFPPRLTDLHEESLFDALQFKQRVVPFINDGDRGGQVDGTVDWILDVADRPDVKVAVVTGPAGAGKSRLAAEICDRVTASHPWWRVGFADYAKLPAAPVPAVPTVVVCDYPERHPEAIGDYLARILDRRRAEQLQAPVRVLMVSRSERSWFDQARSRCRGLGRLIDRRIALDLAEFSSERQLLHADRALAAFCDGFRVPAADRPALEGDRAHFDRPLLVHIDALLTVWRHVQAGDAEPVGPRSPAANERDLLLDDLIDAETSRLLQLRQADGSGRGTPVFGTDGEVREALCVTTLTAPARADLPGLLACTEAYGPHGNPNRVRPADALLRCFPAGDAELIADPARRTVAPVEPDLIAAHLLDRTPGRSAIVNRLVASATVADNPSYHAQLIGALALASEDYPSIGIDLRTHLATSLSALIGVGETTTSSLTELLAKRLGSLIDAALSAAADQDLAAGRELATALLLPTPRTDRDIEESASNLLGRLPYPHQGLAGLGVALATCALAHRERDGHRQVVAQTYQTLSTWLSDYGQWTQALAAGQRSMELFIELASEDPAAYLPGLADTVHGMSVHAARAGLHAEALDAARRELGIWLELAAGDPTAFLPELASCVHSLGNRLAVVGRSDEALLAARDAVERYEKLAAFDRGTYLHKLAMSKNGLGNRLAGCGRHDDALRLAYETTALYTELAAEDRAAHLNNLAASVQNLAVALTETGRPDEAVPVGMRAVMLRQELAADNRTAYLPDLATSVQNLASQLDAAGRHEEALMAARDAVELFRELDAGGPGTHRYGQALSLDLLSAQLAQVGRNVEALAAAQEAIEGFSKLTGTSVGPARPDSTLSPRTLGGLPTGGRQVAAPVNTGHGFSFQSGMPSSGLDPIMGTMARRVHNLGNRLQESGEKTAALEAARLATGVYRDLAERDRAAHVPNLVTSTVTLAVRERDAGLLPASLTAIHQSAELYRELDEAQRAEVLGDLVVMANILEIRLFKAGHLARSLSANKLSAELYRELGEASRAELLPTLGTRANQVSLDLTKAGDLPLALDAALHALSMYRDLNARDRSTWIPELAWSYRHTALLQLQVETDLDLSVEYCDRAIDLYRKLAEHQPDRYREALTMVEEMRALYPKSWR